MSTLRDHFLEKHFFDNITVPAGTLDGIHAAGCIYPNLNGEQGFITSCLPITKPLLMEPEPVFHDFDQMCFFCGGDAAHMDELGGVVTFELGDEDGHMEKFEIVKPTIIYIKKGMIHCPLDFVEIFDETKPIFFQDFTFASVYRRFRPGHPDEPLNEKFERIEKTW